VRSKKNTRNTKKKIQKKNEQTKSHPSTCPPAEGGKKTTGNSREKKCSKQLNGGGYVQGRRGGTPNNLLKPQKSITGKRERANLPRNREAAKRRIVQGKPREGTSTLPSPVPSNPISTPGSKIGYLSPKNENSDHKRKSWGSKITDYQKKSKNQEGETAHEQKIKNSTRG